jgi:hypothetical protein
VANQCSLSLSLSLYIYIRANLGLGVERDRLQNPWVVSANRNQSIELGVKKWESGGRLGWTQSISSSGEVGSMDVTIVGGMDSGVVSAKTTQSMLGQSVLSSFQRYRE